MRTLESTGTRLCFALAPSSDCSQYCLRSLRGAHRTGMPPWFLERSGEARGIARERRRKDSPHFLTHFRQICEVVKKSSDSHLKPYLQTLPGLEPSHPASLVTLMIDQVAGIDYRLFRAPQVTSKSVDIPIKGEFFSQSQRTPVPFDAPAMMLPQQYDRMVYFAVSEYVFNTASRVYHQAGLLNVTISNEHLAGLFPNMQVQLEASPESEPHLWFTPGKVTIAPVMDVQAFGILPNSSDRRPLFQLRVKTNFSISISVNSDRIVGSVSPESELKLELKHSNIGSVDVEEMETIFNVFAREVIYPSLNAQLKKGFPLPVPRNIFLNSVELQIHEVRSGTWGGSKPCWEVASGAGGDGSKP
ncbi:Hypothetical predicted protein [Marmota monax]|uniref:Bactericidal permeability-increasing protein n=1 Tax=Marmota monax TaxID=9995 RepID=A0A5E4A6W2_MARMO|nr:hypothetical protein GHT09_003790 [Marmota monax]VTJ53013.1 Hypothetical predicted protein [Marmota monax]